MKINNFRGDLTDISAKKEALASAAVDEYECSSKLEWTWRTNRKGFFKIYYFRITIHQSPICFWHHSLRPVKKKPDVQVIHNDVYYYFQYVEKYV